MPPQPVQGSVVISRVVGEQGLIADLRDCRMEALLICDMIRLGRLVAACAF
ncbi:MAG: hypothetical protein JWL61_2119 [Gemmatimonadetes bacterium]|nr:hypothetical protein [Gemmatimonadota bacterium]